MNKKIKGFSKLSKDKKLDWVVNNFFNDSENAKKIIRKYLNNDQKLQKLHDEFSENTLTNFYLPFSIAPNFLINSKVYSIQMLIEERSVIIIVAMNKIAEHSAIGKDTNPKKKNKFAKTKRKPRNK